VARRIRATKSHVEGQDPEVGDAGATCDFPHPTSGLGILRRGFTLAESLIASVVLATAVVGVASALAVSSSQATATDVDTRSVALARQLMEEILSRPFAAPSVGDQPGWSAGNHVKASYDNIADFNGYTDTVSPAAAAVSSPKRELAASRVSYARQVSFEYRNSPSGAAVVSGEMGLLTVTIAPAGTGSPYVLHRLVTRCTMLRD
jgi:prepilin-type N-terminal cleavage/methylation domain-containing protein